MKSTKSSDDIDFILYNLEGSGGTYSLNLLLTYHGKVHRQTDMVDR